MLTEGLVKGTDYVLIGGAWDSSSFQVTIKIKFYQKHERFYIIVHKEDISKTFHHLTKFSTVLFKSEYYCICM